MKIYIHRTGTIGLLVLFSLALLITIRIGGWSTVSSEKCGSTIDNELLKASGRNEKVRLRIAITPSTDFIGGILANGGLETSKDSIYSKKHSLLVSFRMVEDFTRCISLLQKKEVDVIWATPGLFALHSGRLGTMNTVAFLQYAWSRGDDILLVKKGVRALSDLSGGSLAASRGSSAQFLAYYLIQQSALQPENIKIRFTHTDADSLTLFLNGRVDACAISFTEFKKRDLQEETGTVLMSTRDASRLISGIFLTTESFIVLYRDMLEKFSLGWFEGVSLTMSKPDNAVEKFAEYLQFNKADITDSLGRKGLTTFSDNCKFFGLKGEKRAGFNDLYEISVSLCNIAKTRAYIRSASLAKNTGILVSLLKGKTIRYRKETGEMVLFASQGAREGFIQAELTGTIPVSFNTNSHDISFEAVNELKEIAVKALIFGSAEINVRGFADQKNETAADYLRSLRTEKVIRYLVSECNIPSYRFRVLSGVQQAARDIDKKSRVDFQLISSGK